MKKSDPKEKDLTLKPTHGEVYEGHFYLAVLSLFRHHTRRLTVAPLQ